MPLWLLWDPRTKPLGQGPGIALYKEPKKRTKHQPRWHRVPGQVTPLSPGAWCLQTLPAAPAAQLGLGRGSLACAFLGVKKNICFAPPTVPFLLPESKATPRSSHWQPLWECVFCVIVSTKIAAELGDSPPPSPLQRSSSKTGAKLPIGIWPEDGKIWGDIFCLHRRGLLESQTLSF